MISFYLFPASKDSQSHVEHVAEVQSIRRKSMHPASYLKTLFYASKKHRIRSDKQFATNRQILFLSSGLSICFNSFIMVMHCL